MWSRSSSASLLALIIVLILVISECQGKSLASRRRKKPKEENNGMERVEKRFLFGLFGHENTTTKATTKATAKTTTTTKAPTTKGVEHHGMFDGLSDFFEGLEEEVEEIGHEVSEAWHGLTDGVIEKIGNVTAKIENAMEELDMDMLGTSMNKLAHDMLDKAVDMTMTPINFLKKYGYLPESGQDFNPIAIVKALLNFQHMYDISLSGILDIDSLQAMLQPRCGMKDVFTQIRDALGNLLPHEKRGIVKRFNVPGYKWPKKDLTWKIHNFYQSAEMPPDLQRRALYEALDYWQQASGLTFREVSDKADLNIHFVWKDHGDGSQNAFDGPGGVLAHAFYPQSGEAHFDNSERFTHESTQGINLKIVAAHEFGHAFGLGHSDVKGALMAPYYQGYEPNYKLPADDIQGIQKIYGSRDGSVVAAVTNAPTTTTTQRRIEPAGAPPATCTVTFRAITQTHDYRIYAYYGRWMWRMSEYGLDEGFPVTIDTYYENPPDNIEAALFSRDTYNTYFFKGKDVWVYYGFQLVDKRTITTPGYPSTVQTALKTSAGQICVIQGTYCWVFNEDTLNVDSSTPRKLSDLFPGAPYLYDSAVRLVDDNDIFFFYGTNYYRYRESLRSVVSGYPKSKAGPWMGPACGSQPYTPK